MSPEEAMKWGGVIFASVVSLLIIAMLVIMLIGLWRVINGK